MFNQRNQSGPFGNIPPNSEIDDGPDIRRYVILGDISQEILSVELIDGAENRGLILADCGNYCTVDDGERQFPKLAGRSYTGQTVCRLHMRFCWICGRVLCTAGTVDGLRFETDEGKGLWLCLDCHEAESRKQRRTYIIRGFLRGFFGGRKENNE